jgi:hypothetical protein
MTEYVAGLCRMAEGELTPFETLAITAASDDEAVGKAIEWRVNTMTNVPLDQSIWLQVLRDGRAIYSQQFGQF